MIMGYLAYFAGLVTGAKSYASAGVTIKIPFLPVFGAACTALGFIGVCSSLIGFTGWWVVFLNIVPSGIGGIILIWETVKGLKPLLLQRLTTKKENLRRKEKKRREEEEEKRKAKATKNKEDSSVLTTDVVEMDTKEDDEHQNY